MSVTESIDGIDFHYRILSDTSDVYIQWHMKELPDLFNGKAYSHEEKIEHIIEYINIGLNYYEVYII